MRIASTANYGRATSKSKGSRVRFTASTPRFLYRHNRHKSTYSVNVSRSTSPGARARCIEQALHISFTVFRPVLRYIESCAHEGPRLVYVMSRSTLCGITLYRTNFQ